MTYAKAPEVTPAVPIPAIALPRMKTGELGAVAQMTALTRKITKDVRMPTLVGSKLYSFPNNGWNAPAIRRLASKLVSEESRRAGRAKTGQRLLYG